MPIPRRAPALLLSFALMLAARPGAASPVGDAIDAELARQFAPALPGAAVLVMKDGVTILDRGYGLANVELDVPVQPAHLFDIASVGKQFTAAGIMKLVEAGKLTVSDPIQRFFPNLPPAWHGITVQQLLQHTSGIPNIFADPAFRQRAFEPHTPEQMLAQAEGMALLAPAGAAFAYSSMNYTLLAMIIGQVSGERYDAYLARQFFVPLGMTHTHFKAGGAVLKGAVTPYQAGPRLAPRWDNSLSFGGGGFASTNADMARWTMALQGGMVLRPASLSAMNRALILPDGKRIPYGYGVRPHTLAGQPYLQSNGDVQGFHAEMVYLPTSKVFVSLLTNGEEARYGLQPLAKRIATMAAGMPQHPVVAQALADAVLRERAGVYLHGDLRYTVELKAGKLFVQYRSGGMWAPLSALSPTDFYYDDNRDYRIRFFTGKNGRPCLQWYDIEPLDDATDPVFEKQAIMPGTGASPISRGPARRGCR